MRAARAFLCVVTSLVCIGSAVAVELSKDTIELYTEANACGIEKARRYAATSNEPSAIIVDAADQACAPYWLLLSRSMARSLGFSDRGPEVDRIYKRSIPEMRAESIRNIRAAVFEFRAHAAGK